MIDASFGVLYGRSAAIDGVYQYDTGQRLRMHGLPSPEELAARDEFIDGDSVEVEVHFGYAGDSQSETRKATYDSQTQTWVSQIPDVYMTRREAVHVYIYVKYGVMEQESRTKTCYEAVFTPIGRPAPGTTITPNQANAWDVLVQEVNTTLSAMNEAISRANAAVEGANQWDGAKADAVTLEAGMPATVEVSERDGKKFILYGIPRGETGKEGPPGERGPIGPPGTSGVTFRLSEGILYIDTQ